MPHQCTDCGRTFQDGSKEMLSGCPDCGGNKFQFKPDSAAEESEPVDSEPPEPPEPPVDSSVARTVGNAATAVRDIVGGSSSEPEPRSGATESTVSAGGRDDADVAPETTSEVTPETAEDAAQASARSEIVSRDDIPAADVVDTESPILADSEPETVSEDSATMDAESSGETDGSRGDERPDLADLREELNDQFESIRVLEPGQYELNLMELFDREEYIIALQEDGKYTIQVPEHWEDD